MAGLKSCATNTDGTTKVLRYRLGGHFFNRLIRLGEAEGDQQFDDRPGRIELARTEAELGAARITVMIVVQSFTACQQRENAKIGGRVVEVLVADVVTQPVDR